jgi:hypothetical protein
MHSPGYMGCSARPRTDPLLQKTATDGLSAIFDRAFWLVRLAGFEPATRCLEDVIQVSDVASYLGK